MRVLFTCGGTGGHINPAVAVANTIKEKHPDSAILFAGATGGMENELVPREGYELRCVDISRFERSLTPKSIVHNIKTALTLGRAKKQAARIIKEFKPDVVVGTGGYASYPIINMASKLGIPTAIHESNFAPGLTTRMLAPKADRIMVNYPECAAGYPEPEKVVVTGTPVREGFLYSKKSEAKKALGYGDEPIVLSYWGSLGAREMNKKIADFMAIEKDDGSFRHIHATGSFGWRWMPDFVKEHGVELENCPGIEMVEYIYNMPALMAAADIIICRAGASTISEVCAASVPAVIVPSPNVAENHQEKNARALEQKGAAIVLLEKDANGQNMYRIVKELLADSEKMQAMSRNLASLAVLDSAEQIYNIILSLIKH